jgi:DNA invertase Pin-like site-specific DNA recombinase
MDHAAIPPTGSDPLSYSRCAVYARTSRETEAEPIYSSIEAQRDACYAHLHKPQSPGQPSVLPSSAPPARLHADAGFSGATLQRPALQRLLADVAAGLFRRGLPRLSRHEATSDRDLRRQVITTKAVTLMPLTGSTCSEATPPD